jgi:FkbM family methyltransferase
MVELVCEHSVDISLIKRYSRVLDLGCRNFGFANEMLKYVDEVYCVDADNSVKTDDPRIHLINVAVGNENKIQEFVKFGNGTGNYLENGEPRPAEYKSELVQVWTLEKISHYFGVYDWSLIKVDIEGEEYDLLMNLFRPMAIQITFELHQHTPKKRTAEEIHKLFNHLSKWYEFKVVDESHKHGCPKNYWDILIVKK